MTTTYGALTGPGGFAKRYTFYIDPMGVVRKVDEKVQPFSAGNDVVDNVKALAKTVPAPTVDELNARIRQLNARVRSDPNDKSAASDLALALYLKGRAIMQEVRFSPKIRYPEARKLFDRALALDPDLVAAREDRAEAEAIGRPRA